MGRIIKPDQINKAEKVKGYDGYNNIADYTNEDGVVRTDLRFLIEFYESYLNKLYEVFMGTINAPVSNHHFASLVFVDRICNFHFKNSEIKDDIPDINIRSVYESKSSVEDYIKVLRELNSISHFKDVFTFLIQELEGSLNKFGVTSQNWRKAYELAFAVCLRHSGIPYDPKLFGQLFNRVLSKRLNGYKYLLGEDSANFIDRIIASQVKVSSKDHLFYPDDNLGGLVVELAHANNCFDFKITRGTMFRSPSFENIDDKHMDILCKINLLVNGLFRWNILPCDSENKPVISDSSADLCISDNQSALPLLLEKSKPKGRIICVVSDEFLTGKEGLKMRKSIVDNNHLRKIYSLPHYLMDRGNLIYLNKSANGGDRVEFYHCRDALKIMDANSVSEYVIEEFIRTLANNKKTTKGLQSEISIPRSSAPKSLIIENDYELATVGYTHPIVPIISKAKEDGTVFVKLKDIVSSPEASYIETEKYTYWNLPYIKAVDLKKADGELLYSQLNFKKVKRGRIIQESSLLVANSGHDLMPTFLTINAREKVVVAKNILVFRVDAAKVNTAYLISQLKSDLIKQQVDLLRKKYSIEILPKNIFSKIEIPVPLLTEQLEWVAKNIRKITETSELASFIKSIPLIESREDLKKEIERFTKAQFRDADSVQYNDYFGYDKYPFSSNEMANFLRAKKLDRKTTLIALQNDEYGYFGAIEVRDTNPIDYSKIQTINEYASFLRKIYDFLTKSSINRQLDSFAHTSKNFFYKLQGEVSLLLNSKNENFRKILDTTYVEPPEVIAHFEKKRTKSKNEFLLRNQLNSIKDQISAQYNFYNQIHEHYTEIKNASLSEFYVPELVDEISPQFNGKLKHAALPRILVFGKRTLLKHALIDLIGNAIKYSSDGNCNLEISDKGNSFVIALSNSVLELLNEERYAKLGQTWLKDSAGQDHISYGVYYAFQMIRESFGEASLADYGDYKHDKIFKVLIRLRKYE